MTPRLDLLILEALGIATSNNPETHFTFKRIEKRKQKKSGVVQWHIFLSIVKKNRLTPRVYQVILVRRSGKLILLGHQYEYVKPEKVKPSA